jgi:hypothetical protein
MPNTARISEIHRRPPVKCRPSSYPWPLRRYLESHSTDSTSHLLPSTAAWIAGDGRGGTGGAPRWFVNLACVALFGLVSHTEIVAGQTNDTTTLRIGFTVSKGLTPSIAPDTNWQTV